MYILYSIFFVLYKISVLYYIMFSFKRIFGKLLPTALKIMSEYQQQQQYTMASCQSEIFSCIISRISATVAECFQQNEVWLLAEKCLKDQRTAVRIESDQSVCPAVMFLNQVCLFNGCNTVLLLIACKYNHHLNNRVYWESISITECMVDEVWEKTEKGRV